MANKVITIGGGYVSPVEVDKEIFKDISLESSYNKNFNTFKVERNVNVDAVRNAIRNIFTWLPGERILDPEFGNTVVRHLYNGINTYNSEQIVAEINRLVEKYEPRAEIDSIINENRVQDTENNTIELKIVWHVRGFSNQKFTQVISI